MMLKLESEFRTGGRLGLGIFKSLTWVKKGKKESMVSRVMHYFKGRYKVVRHSVCHKIHVQYMSLLFLTVFETSTSNTRSSFHSFFVLLIHSIQYIFTVTTTDEASFYSILFPYPSGPCFDSRSFKVSHIICSPFLFLITPS